METHEHIMAYYPLFEHMQNEHGLTLLESELQEIIRLSDEVKKRYNKASEGTPQPSTASNCNLAFVMPMLRQIAECLDNAIENTEDDNETEWNKICNAVELLNDIAEDNKGFIRN